MKRMFPIMLACGFLLGAVPAAAQFALTWSGVLSDSTRVTVTGFYATAWPGVPGKPVIMGSAGGAVAEPAADTAPEPVLHAVFGDGSTLRECAVVEDQGPVHRDGEDGYFFARPGAFAGAASVTVFFAWNGDLFSEACRPTRGLRFDLPGDRPQAARPPAD